ncbi:unnamed protein product [Zymoseptoria tritici ST99CH_3D1]|nr:unnamed protein product [Zymoseptoria tritici ST99CH_3D1]
MVDGFVAYFLLLVHRAETLWRRIADDKRSPLSLFRHGLVSFAIWALIWPSLILLLIGAVTPASEAKAWGNYHLRFFSARARRAIRPFTALDASPSTENSPSGLYPELAYTLYVPGAGFLWSDAMMWNQSLPSTSSRDTDVKHDHLTLDWLADESWRVFFQDKYSERYPWVVDIATDPLRSGREKLPVKSTGNSVVSEAGYVDSKAEHIGRIRVGTLQEYHPEDCDWSAFYDASTDREIAFYNLSHECTLATTFRSIPEAIEQKTNDTVQLFMNLKVEASCTKSASSASSRMFLIETALRSKLTVRPAPQKTRRVCLRTLKDAFRWA